MAEADTAHFIQGRSSTAFVLPRLGHKMDEAHNLKLVQQVCLELSRITAPSELGLPDQMPETRSGKIMCRKLQAQEIGLDHGDLGAFGGVEASPAKSESSNRPTSGVSAPLPPFKPGGNQLS
jgi:hypothetical protein